MSRRDRFPTGGGSGGTVAILARRGSLSAVKAIACDYARRTGMGGDLIASLAATGGHDFLPGF